MKIISFQDISSEKWNEFVDKSSNSWLYHRASFINRYEKKTNISFAIIDPSQKGEILAICPLFIFHEKKVISNIFIRPFIKTFLKLTNKYKSYYITTDNYGPSIINTTLKRKKKIEKFLFQYLETIAKNKKATRLEVNLDITQNITNNYNPLWNYGFFKFPFFMPRLATIIDLTKDENNILMEMEEDCRSAIRKAKRENFEIEIGDSDEISKRFFDLFVNTQTRLKGEKYSIPFEIFKKYFCTKENDKKTIVFIIIKDKDKDISGIALQFYKDWAIYFRAGNREEYFKYRVNNLALWEGIKYAKKQGYKKFNVGVVYPSKPDNTNYSKEDMKEYTTGEYKKQFTRDLYPIYSGVKYYK
jgi:lipid II:glycine glycyltransferase (peptidoglycan interpeptide bridge formation enzyme)